MAKRLVSKKTIHKSICVLSIRVLSISSKETPPPGGVFCLLCSLTKSRVQEISPRDATVASRREISYTRLLIREHSI